MRITAEEVYAIKGLKVGDKIKFTNGLNIYILEKYSLETNEGVTRSIDSLLDGNFEKVESKIWERGDIKKGDNMYFIDGGVKICHNRYGAYDYEKEVHENSIAFKKKEYAQEYLEKLIEFIGEYKNGEGK